MTAGTKSKNKVSFSAVDVVLAAEARGLILGGAIARALDAGLAVARKPGKLPWKTITFCRPVAHLASFTQSSLSSAPLVAKKKRLIC